MENYCGKRLDGRYEIREIIGVGGMAVVYKAYDNIDDRIVAVKILKEEFLANEEFRRRFKNESKAIAVLSHPNIVKVYDVSFGDRLQYIVMEYIEGITLKEYIEQQKIINWKETVHFVSQILLALQHAHDKGIVHRDIKPQNIMLLQDGTIKVTDFGIARFSRSDTKTMTEDAIGSVHYISPEQARGEITDDKADLYSVGVVMYEMLTGQLPFQSDNAVSIAIMQLQQEAKPPREINPEIPLGLEQITLRAMQKNPNNRYHSAAEMMLDIDEFKRNPLIKFNYNYFVDEEPTKFVDKSVTGGISTAPKTTEEVSVDEDDTEEVKNNKTMPILFGILAGVVVLVAVIAGVLIFGNAKKVTVPNFVGMNYIDEIMSNSEYTDNFTFETESVYSKEVAAGVVMKQTPEADGKIKKGKTIKLEIAYNDASILITGIKGLTGTEAQTKLKNSGFEVKIIESYDKNAPVGIVFNSYPTEGSYAEKGSLVTIYVSTDQNPNAVAVPSVTSFSQDLATQMLKSAGFTVTVTQQDSAESAGTVVNQEPASGTQADKGSAVTIFVSTGTPSESTATISVKLPTTKNSSSGTMKVYLNSDVNTTFDDVLLSGDTKTFDIKGTGAENTFTVKINDQTVLTGKIDFTKSPAVITGVVETAYVEKLSVPDVRGSTESEAKNTLKNAGFTNVTVLGTGTSVASQEPLANTMWDTTGAITITLG